MNHTQAKPPRVAVIIPTHNGWERLQVCLPLILNQDWPDLHVVVVDDGSSDRTPVKIGDTFPGVQVVALSQNLGFAGACNAGVRATPCEYAAIINDDALLPNHAIRGLAQALENNPQAAVAGPAVDNLNMDMSHYPWVGSMSLTGTVIQGVFKDPRLSFGAAGCAFMYRRDLLGEPFDAEYEFFHEEVYLAWRARLQGYTVLRVPEVVVRHVGAASLGPLTDRYRFLMERNRMLNFLTLFSFWTRVRIWPLLGIAHGLEWGADMKAGRSRAPYRQSRQWLREHAVDIRTKRKRLQNQRRVSDSAILRWMSCRVTNDRSFWGRLANALACLGCRLLGLKTWERMPQA